MVEWWLAMEKSKTKNQHTSKLNLGIPYEFSKTWGQHWWSLLYSKYQLYVPTVHTNCTYQLYVPTVCTNCTYQLYVHQATISSRTKMSWQMNHGQYATFSNGNHYMHIITRPPYENDTLMYFPVCVLTLPQYYMKARQDSKQQHKTEHMFWHGSGHTDVSTKAMCEQ